MRLWRTPGGEVFPLSVTAVFDETTIAEAARRLAAAAPGSRVVLFGSHARGEAGPRSDPGFLVIGPEVENVAQESVRLGRTLDVGAVTDEIVGFHAQQAVEKALKAVPAIRGVGLPFTQGGGLDRPTALRWAERTIAWAESVIDAAGRRPRRRRLRRGGAFEQCN